jgi:sugar phosphate isomerase/epimerase
MKRISIGSWAYAIGPYADNPIPWDEVTKTLKSLHFDGVELGGFSIHPSPETHPKKEDRERLRAEMGKVGLAFSGFVPNLWDQHLIDTEDPQPYINKFKAGLEFAADLGIKGLRVDCVQPPTILDTMDEAVAMKRVVKTWQTCCDLAAEKGCYVTWEFEPGFAFNKPSQIVKLVEEVDRDNFGTEFDTCHAEMVAGKGARQPGKKEVLPGGCLELARRLRGKINHIHLIDSDGTLHGEETSSHAPFGDGYLNFDEIMPELNKNRLPDDWWCIDLCFWPDAWKVTEKCKVAVDALNKKYG